MVMGLRLGLAELALPGQVLDLVLKWLELELVGLEPLGLGLALE